MIPSKRKDGLFSVLGGNAEVKAGVEKRKICPETQQKCSGTRVVPNTDRCVDAAKDGVEREGEDHVQKRG